MVFQEIDSSEYRTLYEGSCLSILQSTEWAALKQKDGFTPHYYKISSPEANSTAPVGAFLILAKSVPVLGDQAYMPRPIFLFDPANADLFKDVFTQLKLLTSNFAAIFFDLDIPQNLLQSTPANSQDSAQQENPLKEWKTKVEKLAEEQGFTLGKTIQPQNSIFVRLDMSEEDWIKSMKRPTRRWVKIAVKNSLEGGVTAEVAKDSQLYSECAAKLEEISQGKYSGRKKEYYLRMKDEFKDDILCIALMKDKKCAGATLGVVDHNNSTLRVFYTGNTKEMLREYHAGYLTEYARWHAAKEAGLKWMDLWGYETDPKHPWYGFSVFKEGFGGTIVEYPRQIQVFRNSLVKTAFKLYRRK
jgi:lipid II:glycine glycyltransferase (peptidoglycan interpeptide bridge formation enzyme)